MYIFQIFVTIFALFVEVVAAPCSIHENAP